MKCRIESPFPSGLCSTVKLLLTEKAEICIGLTFLHTHHHLNNLKLLTQRRPGSNHPVPALVRLAKGSLRLNSRGINPGAWTIIEGDPGGESTLLLGLELDGEPRSFPVEPIRQQLKNYPQEAEEFELLSR